MSSKHEVEEVSRCIRIDDAGIFVGFLISLRVGPCLSWQYYPMLRLIMALESSHLCQIMIDYLSLRVSSLHSMPGELCLHIDCGQIDSEANSVVYLYI